MTDKNLIQPVLDASSDSLEQARKTYCGVGVVSWPYIMHHWEKRQFCSTFVAEWKINSNVSCIYHGQTKPFSPLGPNQILESRPFIPIPRLLTSLYPCSLFSFALVHQSPSICFVFNQHQGIIYSCQLATKSMGYWQNQSTQKTHSRSGLNLGAWKCDMAELCYSSTHVMLCTIKQQEYNKRENNFPRGML